jgi:hypothetical protein
VNDELGGMWTGVMVYCELLFWHLIGGTEETHEETKAPGSQFKS